MSIPFATFLGSVATCLIVELTLGPNMAWLAFLAATRGRRAGLAAVLGVGLGLLILGLATAFGLAVIIARKTLLYQALRSASISYFLWLAWAAWQSASETSPGIAVSKSAQSAYFTRGLITNLLNPKAALFYVAILPSFVDPADNLAGQTITLSLIYVAIATFVHSLLVALAGFAEPLLNDLGRIVLARCGFAVTILAIAIWLAIKT